MWNPQATCTSDQVGTNWGFSRPISGFDNSLEQLTELSSHNTPVLLYTLNKNSYSKSTQYMSPFSIPILHPRQKSSFCATLSLLMMPTLLGILL